MRSIGIDLHKRSLTVCVIDKSTGETFISRFLTADPARIRAFFEKQRPFEAVVEASATYEWLWVLLEPLAERLVLAHPSKLRIIAESKKKTDRFDARALAHLLAQDEVPEAYRPSPQQREYQHLVKHRVALVRQRSRLRVQIRSILAARNLDQPRLFRLPKEWFSNLPLPAAEKFRVLELLSLLEVFKKSIEIATRELKAFREAAPEDQKKNHQIAKSVPGVGDLTADVVLASLGPVERFRSIEKVPRPRRAQVGPEAHRAGDHQGGAPHPPLGADRGGLEGHPEFGALAGNLRVHRQKARAEKGDHRCSSPTPGSDLYPPEEGRDVFRETEPHARPPGAGESVDL